MNNNLNHINGVIKKSIRFLFFVLFFQAVIISQSISNLDKFYQLVDSASTEFVNDIGNAKKVKLELNLGTDYSLFANQVRGKILRKGIEIVGENSSQENIINVNFVIDNCFVDYTEPERDGIFGDFLTERTIELSGNYYISTNFAVKDFKFTGKDTIKVEEVEKFENRSYPFTQGELPPEPFFSSLLEPIVAIGAAAVTVILFFSVRSK
ncbi:MAG: hypothetical protein Q8M94_13470 [Ignavibacteria bacterium]|nr:hypothetical protein [Ignavibacteria bacterium]